MVSLEKAKETTLAKVIYSLGITGIPVLQMPR